MKKYFPIKTIIAIICITILEALAMGYGVNGVSLAAAIAAIAGLGGFAIGQARATQGTTTSPK